MGFQSLFQAFLYALLLAIAATPVQAQNTLSLSTSSSDPLFTFQYSTTQASSTNWIGLWNATGGGPVDQKKHSPSLVWQYAPSSQGSVYLNTSNLQPGTNYTAFFLANNGYKWIANPVNVSMPAKTSAMAFMATAVTLRNSRQGDRYSYNISGLVKGGGKSLRFSKISSSNWASVSSDGIISGTPDKHIQVVVEVRVTDETKATATAKFTIPVRGTGAYLVPQLQVLTFNMWLGGTQVNNYFEKQVRFLVTSGADVVGLQEDKNGAAPLLAAALGWYSWTSGGDVSILSKYPIAEAYGIISTPYRSGGARIALDTNQAINFYVAHLGSTPYGPYDFCFDSMTKEQVMTREVSSGRVPQINTTLIGMDSRLAQSDQVPTLLVGDFNAPSHLDWVEGLKEKNCGYSDVDWPESQLITDRGLVDSFRVANPDPTKVQGITWSPLNPWNTSRKKPEPQDRIDFIYHKGKALSVLKSQTIIVGTPNTNPNAKDNEWTSDHAAVLTTYKFTM